MTLSEVLKINKKKQSKKTQKRQYRIDSNGSFLKKQLHRISQDCHRYRVTTRRVALVAPLAMILMNYAIRY